MTPVYNNETVVSLSSETMDGFVSSFFKCYKIVRATVRFSLTQPRLYIKLRDIIMAIKYRRIYI